MRLRRDSQGNYTYQYVADEEKLGELQAALADAQANLYETDKDHYKQNLNNLYDTYKEYIEKMRDLTEEYNNTQDEEERNRISFMGEQYRNSLMLEKIQEKYSNSNYYGAQLIYNAFFLCPLRKEEDIMNPLLFLEKGDYQVLYKLHQKIINVFPNKEEIEHQLKELRKYQGQD